MKKTFPKVTMIETTSTCNASCFYCYNERKAACHYKNKTIREMIDRLISLGTKTVILSGGEPTLHPNIDAIITYILSRNIYLGVVTNGIKLNQELIESLKDERAFVQVSLDTVNKEAFKVSRGVDCVDKVKENISKLKTAGINCIIAITLSNVVSPYLDETIKFCIGKGIKSIHVSEVKPVGRGSNRGRFYEVEDLFAVLKKMYNYHKSYYPEASIDMIHDFIVRFLPGKANTMAFCNAMCGNALQITADGDVCTCENLRDFSVSGNIYRNGMEVLDTTFNSDHLFKINQEQLWECKKCEFLMICRGGCRALTYHRTGDLYGKHPRCAEIKKLLKLIRKDIDAGKIDNVLFHAELSKEKEEMSGFVKWI